MENLAETLKLQLSQISNYRKVVTYLALPAAGFLAARFIDGYRQWLALGPGGAPYNVLGYTLNVLLGGIVGRNENKSLKLYDRPEKYLMEWTQASEKEKALAKKSFLKEPLLQRLGPEENAIKTCIPQRQKTADEYFDPQLKEAYLQLFTKLGEKHSDSIQWSTSALERRGRAMFLKDDYALPAPIIRGKREVCHIHESDMSAHTFLSLEDARDVIAKGWGERHMLSGTAIIPLPYTLLYLPRNHEELEVLEHIFEAGIQYAKSNGKK